MSEKFYIPYCENCGNSVYSQDIIHEGYLYHYKCSNCGHLTRAGTVCYAPLEVPDYTVYAVIITWKNGKPDLQEIKAVRSLIPKYKAMRVVEVKEQLSAVPGIRIDDLREGDALEYKAEADKLGLNLSIAEMQVNLD